MTTEAAPAPQGKTTTLAGWKKAKVHTIRVPSGVYVDIQIPDLPELIRAGQIPNALIDAALGVVNGNEKVDVDFVIKQAEFTNKLLSFTLVTPKVTEDEAKEIPAEDKELISQIATRQRDLDAEGHHIGGLHTSADFRNFRGLSNGDPLLEDL